MIDVLTPATPMVKQDTANQPLNQPNKGRPSLLFRLQQLPVSGRRPAISAKISTSSILPMATSGQVQNPNTPALFRTKPKLANMPVVIEISENGMAKAANRPRLRFNCGAYPASRKAQSSLCL